MARETVTHTASGMPCNQNVPGVSNKAKRRSRYSQTRYTSRGNDGSSATPLPPDRIGLFIPSGRDASGGASLLGISICPDRVGKITQLGKNYGVLRQSQHSVPGFECPLRLRSGVRRRYSSNARPVFAAHRTPVGVQHVRCILDRRSRSVLCHLFGPRKVLRGRSLHLPVRGGKGSGLLIGLLCNRYSHRQTADNYSVVTLPQTLHRSESEIISAVLAGEIQVYHELSRAYERSVYVMAFSYMRNREDAQDVSQEVFCRALRKLA